MIFNVAFIQKVEEKSFKWYQYQMDCGIVSD
jgi:hypothetical protein